MTPRSVSHVRLIKVCRLIVYLISARQASPICNLNVALPDSITPEVPGDPETISALQNKYGFLKGVGEASYYVKFDTIHRADLRISDIGNLLGPDWVNLAHELRIPDSDINIIKSEYPENEGNIAWMKMTCQHYHFEC